MKNLKIYSRILSLLCLLAFVKTAIAQSPCQPTLVVNGNVNGAVAFYAMTTNTAVPGTLFWNFGNGSSFTSTNSIYASANYTANGVYTVSVTYVNAANTCTGIASQTVLISNANCSLNAGYIANGSQGTYTFVSNSTGVTANTSYNWTFGDGASGTGSVVVHTYTNSGNYTPTLTISETIPNTCSDGYTSYLQVCVGATPTITAVNGSNGSVTFSITAPTTTMAIAQWGFGDGTYGSSYSSTINHTYAANGLFSVSLWYYTGTCTLMAQYTATVSNITNPCNISANFSSSSPLNGVVNFVNTSTGTSGGVTYTWNFGDGSPNSNAVNPSHTFPATGFYVVSLTANNNYSYACADTQTYQIWVPTCTFVPTFTATNGANGSVSFASNITGTTVSNNWYWYFGDGSPILYYALNPTHNYRSDGTYTVTLIAGAYGCSTNTVTGVVTITGCDADATFSMAPSGTPQVWNAFPASPGNVALASWNWGDGSTSNTLFTSHTYSAAGNYNICLTFTSNCGDTSTYCYNYAIYKPANGAEDMSVVQVNVLDPATVGIKNNSKNDMLFNIYPNPSNGNFSLKLSGSNAERAQVEVYNLVGQKLYTTTIDMPGGMFTKELQLSDVANGVYLLKISAGDQVLTQKIMITKN